MHEPRNAAARQAVLLAGFPLAVSLCLQAVADPLPEHRQQELQYLLYQDCGSCHGMRLTGGLGPALTPEALAGKPRALLAATIRDGRIGTPMPPWKDILDEADIAWLVDTLQQPRPAP